jgi:very-short-patch-repair endonuclease
VECSNAWRTRRASPASLEQRLRELKGQRRSGTAALRLILRDAVARGRPLESILEVRLWWMLKQAGLPRPQAQYRVPDGRGRGIRLDFAYPKQGLAIEADSMQFHGDKPYFVAHCDRLTRLAASGWRVMHFTQDKLADTERVLALVRAALAKRKP